jgi:hypothetical protein
VAFVGVSSPGTSHPDQVAAGQRLVVVMEDYVAARTESDMRLEKLTRRLEKLTYAVVFLGVVTAVAAVATLALAL